MVRFIIQSKPAGATPNADLHSNMVRFIIKLLAIGQEASSGFTFQYG